MLSKVTFFALLIAAIALITPPTSTAAEDGLNASQKKDVEAVVQEYILKNPEILLRTIQQYQIRQQISERNKAKANLVALAPDLELNPSSPVIGNPKGDVTVVEFFDYRCGYCKQVFPTIQALLKEDGNIRYVLKEFPILGPESLVATQASLAVWNTAPEKYLAFHSALMTMRGQPSDSKIFSIVKKLGIDTDAVRSKMDDAAVKDEINKNGELAESLGISGTPAFVVGNNLAPGAIGIDELKKMVIAARKG